MVNSNNQNNNLIELLQELDLNKRQSSCYLALLELGSSKVGSIIEKTSIPSSKIYDVLKSLIKKGLVSYIIKEKTKHFQASDPKSLLNILEQKKKDLEKSLPELIAKQNFSEKQKVEMFEGQKAIFNMFTNLISDTKPKESYRIFSINEENKNENCQVFFKNLAVRRKEKALDVMLLKPIKYYLKEKHTKLKLRYINLNLPQGITIFRNNIILLSWSVNPIAIKIESKQFSDQMNSFFTDLWNKAKE